MTRIWVWITFAALLIFAIPPIFGVPSDWAVQIHRLFLFVIVGVGFSRYITRAPFLWWEGNTSPEGKQIIGYAVALFALLYQILYAWIYVQIGRPDWLAETYWSDGSTYMMLCGFLLVAWSTRNPAPHVRGNRVSSYLVGLLTGLGLMLSGALPTALKFVAVTFGKLAAFIPH